MIVSDNLVCVCIGLNRAQHTRSDKLEISPKCQFEPHIDR